MFAFRTRVPSDFGVGCQSVFSALVPKLHLGTDALQKPVEHRLITLMRLAVMSQQME